jgi:Na+/H+-dicarboxylate symporter
MGVDGGNTVTSLRGRGWLGFHTWVLLAALAGVASARWPFPGQGEVAHALLRVFMNALNLLSLPIIFLALFTTLCGMETVDELAWLGRRVVRYTLATTVVAAMLALGLFLVVRPVRGVVTPDAAVAPSGSYIDHLVALVPRHVFAPFMDGNVVAVLALAVVFGLAMLRVPDRKLVHTVGAAGLAALLEVIRWVVRGVPLMVWAGVSVSFTDLREHGGAGGLARYLFCVVAANVLQAFVVLPLFLKAHRVAPFASMRRFSDALSLAFFSKSSVATIPVAIARAESELGVHPKVARFTFPICTTINMNGCAAFILTTVLFVSMSNGRTFAPWELGLWVGIATLAAVGNAGVPMGCYFLTSACLVAMGVPIALMTVILPFYSLIDMLETALNVWSDACVAMMVDTHYRAAERAANPLSEAERRAA